MERVNGKTALILLMEEEAGFHDFNEEERAELLKQAKGFFMFLMRQGKTEYEAREICDAIRENTRKELEIDWPDAFRMAENRADNDMEMECDALLTPQNHPEKIIDSEFRDNENHMLKVETVALLASERPDWGRFSKAIEHMVVIEGKIELLEIIKANQKNKLTDAEKQAVKDIRQELDWLRFGKSKGRRFKKICSCHGDGIYISVTMWKKMRNRINALLDIEKRYVIKEFEKDKSEDVLDGALYVQDIENF